MHGQSDSEATSSAKLKNSSFMLHEFQHLFQEGIASAAEGSFHTPHIHALFSSIISDFFFFAWHLVFLDLQIIIVILLFWRTFVLIYFVICNFHFDRRFNYPWTNFCSGVPFKYDRVAAAVMLPNI